MKSAMITLVYQGKYTIKEVIVLEKNKIGLDRRIVTLIFTHGVNHGTLLFFSTVLLVMAKDMQIDYGKLGALVTATFIFYGIGQLPAGVLSDVIGRKNSILMSLVIPLIGCIMGGLFSSFGMMVVAFSLIGLGGSFYHPSSYAMIADVTTEDNRGKAFGWHGVGANIGQALTPVLAGFVSVAYGWRAIFFVWAAICMVNAIAIVLFMPGGKADVVDNDNVVEEAKEKGKSEGWKQLLSVAVILGLFIYAIQGFVNDGIFAYLPSLLQDDFAMAVAISGVITGIQYGGGVFGQLVGGFASDKWNEANVIIAASIGFIITVIVLFVFKNSTPAVVVILFVMGFFLFMLQPPINAIFAKAVPASMLGSSFGVVFIFKYGLGALAPALGGAVASGASLTVFFYLLAGVMGVGVVLTSLLKISLKKRDNHQ